MRGRWRHSSCLHTVWASWMYFDSGHLAWGRSQLQFSSYSGEKKKNQNCCILCAKTQHLRERAQIGVPENSHFSQLPAPFYSLGQEEFPGLNPVRDNRWGQGIAIILKLFSVLPARVPDDRPHAKGFVQCVLASAVPCVPTVRVFRGL